ncbi:hypothetical protein LTR08_002750 [Meristemomyces frigidus]|nr:hypothetical protein LTR08_002750 [Meristemomyces frigidus]
MANGKVVEQGSHSELIERDGLYAAMEPGEEAYKDDPEEARDPPVSPEQTQSDAMPKAAERELEQLTAGTV